MEVSLVEARRRVRTMSGRSQAALIEADSGRYVVKFANNPRGGTRILINEMISSILFSQLGLLTPGPAVIVVESVAGLPSGLHFGSRFPAGTTTVWDIFPDALLPMVQNLHHFQGALLADLWLGASQKRQAIFYRVATDPPLPPVPSPVPKKWVASMIDNASMFQGASWQLMEMPCQGWYPRPVTRDLSMRSFAPWLEAIMSLEWQVLEAAFELVPRAWLTGDESALLRLLRDLYARRQRMPMLLAAKVEGMAKRLAISEISVAEPSQTRQELGPTIVV